MKVACVIVTYNPDPNFYSRLIEIEKEFSTIIIVDNFSEPSLEISNPGVIMIHNSSNLGIATALNQGIITATTLGAEYVCLFDQDSSIEPGFTNLLLSGFSMNSNVAIVAANYINPVSNKSGYTIKEIENDYHYSNINHAITSGSMIKTDVFKICGLMRDDYFIDYVDIEFCERIKKHGFKIICSNRIGMIHPIGEATNHKIFSYKLSASNHSLTRRYYMARNCVRSAIENFDSNPQFAFISIERLLKVLSVTLIFEDQRISKSRAFILGIFDGTFGKMGKTERPL